METSPYDFLRLSAIEAVQCRIVIHACIRNTLHIHTILISISLCMIIHLILIGNDTYAYKYAEVCKYVQVHI